MQTKILLVLFLICSTVFYASAQIKKGAILLGGQLGFSGAKTEYQLTPGSSTKNTSFYVSPVFGKAVKDNLVIGADISFGYGRYENENTNEQNNTTYGAGFFIRQYKELGKGFYLFGQGRLGGYYMRQEQTILQPPAGETLQKSYNIQLSFYPGIAYSATRKLQLEAGLNNMVAVQYNHSPGPATKGNSFSLNTSLNSAMSNFTIGFRVFLN